MKTTTIEELKEIINNYINIHTDSTINLTHAQRVIESKKYEKRFREIPISYINIKAKVNNVHPAVIYNKNQVTNRYLISIDLDIRNTITYFYPAMS